MAEAVVDRPNSIQGYLDNLAKSSMDQSNAWADKFNNPYDPTGGARGGAQFKATYALNDVKNNHLAGVQQNDAEARQLALDPWSYYRSGAADKLSQFAGGEDPSEVFRNKLTQMTMGQFSPDDPSYKWRFDQGQQAVERSLGARGLLNSGNAAIELQQYGQGAASQEYGLQFNRLLQGMSGVENSYNGQFNRLAQLAGISLDPAASAKIEAGITQASIGASAQVASAAIGQSASLARVGLDSQINQQNQANYAAYNQGLGNVLSGKDWQGGV